MVIKKEYIIDGSNGYPITIDNIYKENKKLRGVIIFSHGFKGFKDWGPFNKIARTFAENHFSFVKFNYSHNGITSDSLSHFSDLDLFGNNNFIKELDDLGSVIDWVCETHAIEHSFNQISLFGHSRGGGISLLKAAEDHRISKVISWASPSDFLNKLFLKDASSWKEKGVIYISNSRTKQDMPMYYQFYESCMNNKHKLDISRAVKMLKIPQLIIHGSNDTTVKIVEAETIKSWNIDAELHIIRNANHVFGGFHPYNSHQYPTHLKQAIDLTIQFLEK